MVEAVKQNYPQREIADSAFRYQQEVDSGERMVVGVNGFTEGDEGAISTLRIDPALEAKQIDRVRHVREARDSDAAQAALEQLRTAAADPGENLMPLLLDAARAHASEGEIVETLQAVFGTYTETPVF